MAMGFTPEASKNNGAVKIWSRREPNGVKTWQASCTLPFAASHAWHNIASIPVHGMLRESVATIRHPTLTMHHPPTTIQRPPLLVRRLLPKVVHTAYYPPPTAHRPLPTASPTSELEQYGS